jgi:hypothetical protein
LLPLDLRLHERWDYPQMLVMSTLMARIGN